MTNLSLAYTTTCFSWKHGDRNVLLILEEGYRFAPKASRRPSQSFTTNSRLCHGMLPSPRVNSTPWAAYSAKTVASGEWRENLKQIPPDKIRDSQSSLVTAIPPTIFCARLPRAKAG